jgi:hypothetical protein
VLGRKSSGGRERKEEVGHRRLIHEPGPTCRMDIPGPTTSVGWTDYSVGPWDYLTCATRHLMAWGARTAMEEYSDRKLCMSGPM